MYVKLTNGAVDQFPYTVGQLRRDNPNTSFPKRISDTTLESWDVYPVTLEDEPSFDSYTQYLTEKDVPVLENGTWKLGWTVNSYTAEEITERDSILAESHRRNRDALLQNTDWWALADSPTMTAEQTAYRQALRDITTHANWPHLTEADWPVKP